MRRPIKYHLNPEEKDLHPEYRTVCEVLREAYRTASGHSVMMEESMYSIRELLEEAYDLAKRMDRKLREYNKDWLRDSDVCEPLFKEPLDGTD